MFNADSFGAELLAKEYILIAIIPESFIERMGQHQVALDEEIGGMEVAVGVLPAHLHSVLVLRGFLVEITEIAFEGFRVTDDDDPAVDDCSLFHCQIVRQIVLPYHAHVAVDEKQPVVMSLPGKEIPDGRPAGILCLSEIMAVGPTLYGLVLPDHFRFCRTIVTHQDLIVNGSLLSLLPEVVHQLDTQIIIGGD